MKPLVTDELWKRLEPLIPPPHKRRFRLPGRKPLEYRKIITGILFVLKTGIGWDDLPSDMGCGCGKTCRHYLELWQQAGVWWKLHAVLLAELNGADQIDWSRALIDASFCKAPEGGEDTGPNPTDRRKSGSKHHVLTDAQGIPLNATVTAANVNEVTRVLDVLLNTPAVDGKPGPKRELPERLQGDAGFDSEPLLCCCVGWEQHPYWAKEGSNMVAALASSVGMWNVPSPGFIPSEDCVVAWIDLPKFKNPSFG